MGGVPLPEERKHAVHANAFPENIDYEDTGCHLHKACLSCPFDVCRIDAWEEKLMETATRNERIIMLWKDGQRISDIAADFGLTRGAIYQILKRSGNIVRGKQSNPASRKETAHA